MKGKLYLIPAPLAEGTQEIVLTPLLISTIKTVDHFLCENVRTARRFISSLKVHASIEALHFDLLDKDTTSEEIEALMAPVLSGKDMGLMSESGCPAIADPGSLAVSYAHRAGIKVVPIVGPSSIMLALMASGMNGQRFAFHGYLPVESKERVAAIRTLERESKEKQQTQIFIETPYRNNALLHSLVNTLMPHTVLCIAVNLTGSDEQVISQPVSAWKKQVIQLEKTPVTFLFQAT